jgi:hypothetical protein
MAGSILPYVLPLTQREQRHNAPIFIHTSNRTVATLKTLIRTKMIQVLDEYNAVGREEREGWKGGPPKKRGENFCVTLEEQYVKSKEASWNTTQH